MSPMSGDMVYVRHVRGEEHERLRTLRLASLASSPEAFGSTYAASAAQPPESWRSWAAQSEEGINGRVFVLVDGDDRWLGLAFARLDDGTPGLAWLGGMWIEPEARGRRASVRLCEACAAWAGERGAERLALTVVVGNDTARRVYEAAGFTIEAKETHSYGGRVLEEFIMSRRL